MRKTVFIWLSMILCFLFPIPINASQVKCTTLIENTEGPWNAGGMTVVKNRIYIAKKRYHASENLYCYSIKGKLLSKRKLPKKTGHVNGMTYMEGKLYICNMTNQITVVTNITNLKKAKFSFLKAPCSVYGISHTEKGKLLLLNIQRSSKKCKIRCIQAKIKNKKIIQEKEFLLKAPPNNAKIWGQDICYKKGKMYYIVYSDKSKNTKIYVYDLNNAVPNKTIKPTDKIKLDYKGETESLDFIENKKMVISTATRGSRILMCNVP